MLLLFVILIRQVNRSVIELCCSSNGLLQIALSDNF